MRKILLLALVIFSVVFGYSIAFPNLVSDKEVHQETALAKAPILRVALVADSHNENELLEKALSQAGERNVDFVIGLGDYTNLGTVEELEGAKAVFDKSGLEYYVIPGDRDGWESRQQGGMDSFEQIFGQGTRIMERENVLFVILDNSDIYSGISQEDWEILKSITSGQGTTSTTGQNNKARDTLDTRGTLTFVFAHKTPFHPESAHVMGEDSEEVSVQARRLIELLEGEKVDGFFSGDLHFFAKYQSPQQSVKITTVGAVASQKNFQGPRFAILTVFDDWSWEVEDVEIR